MNRKSKHFGIQKMMNRESVSVSVCERVITDYSV